MRVLITGICGFVGSSLAAFLKRSGGIELFGIDNFCRPGSEINRSRIRELCVGFRHGDLRCPSDVEWVPSSIDWIIDASANPSVMAGVDGVTSSRQIIEHNLLSTINVLELARRCDAGFALLSTSRVYSVEKLSALPLEVQNEALALRDVGDGCQGVSQAGISELFSTSPPISLYGTTKLASEQLALEYASAFGFPAVINRCGILAGAGQFGRADQGILAYWVHSYVRKRPLRYIGFGGTGFQSRDCLHPADLGRLLVSQMRDSSGPTAVCNVSGGAANTFSLHQLTQWCSSRFGPHRIDSVAETRTFDVPWLVLDSSVASERWKWQPTIGRDAILEEIAEHARTTPDWLTITGVAD